MDNLERFDEDLHGFVAVDAPSAVTRREREPSGIERVQHAPEEAGS